MPLASGADVKIGAYEFMLSSAEDSYEHFYENLYGEGGEIEGTEGKKNANKNILFWGYDNWIGGGEISFYDKDQPNRWWTGDANPRIPGAITSPPTKATTNVTTSVTPDVQGTFLVAVQGTLWLFTGEQGWYSTDYGATWTENTDVATELPANYEITGACTDGDFPYICAADSTDNGIWRVSSTTTVDDVVTTSGVPEYRSIAVHEGYLYGWSGGKLYKYRLDTVGGTLPITHSDSEHIVYRAGPDSAAARVPTLLINSSIKAEDNNVIFMRANEGSTELFEWKLDTQTGKQAPRRFWTMPEGFTGLEFCIHTGVVFVAGHYQDRAALWGYSLVNKQPLFLGYFMEAVTGTKNVLWIAPSYGAQVMIGCDDGTDSYVYVYDAEEDAFSLLDKFTMTSDVRYYAGITFAKRRIIAGHLDSTTTKVTRWNLDTDTPAGSWDWTSSAHDFGYPQDEKVLLGFHVVNDPSVAAGTVDLDYQIDESGSWVDSGTDCAAGSKHTYMQISDGSSTVKFRTLRFRLNGSSGARVLSAYARVYINSKQEVWRLKLDLDNEPGTKRRPSNRTANSTKLRNNLHTLVSDGNVVTFLDGRRRVRKSSTSGTGYTSHTVLVEFPKDAVDTGREGAAEVILRSVAPSA